ncbi:hypothetical protein MIR68_002494 [Amoeboaphelidium protococcarum]|nr:hypothetical protein MIR68_002494 [Amoeboaphelidium protococcarum]
MDYNKKKQKASVNGSGRKGLSTFCQNMSGTSAVDDKACQAYSMQTSSVMLKESNPSLSADGYHSQDFCADNVDLDKMAVEGRTESAAVEAHAESDRRREARNSDALFLRAETNKKSSNNNNNKFAAHCDVTWSAGSKKTTENKSISNPTRCNQSTQTDICMADLEDVDQSLFYETIAQEAAVQSFDDMCDDMMQEIAWKMGLFRHSANRPDAPDIEMMTIGERIGHTKNIREDDSSEGTGDNSTRKEVVPNGCLLSPKSNGSFHLLSYPRNCGKLAHPTPIRLVPDEVDYFSFTTPSAEEISPPHSELVSEASNSIYLKTHSAISSPDVSLLNVSSANLFGERSNGKSAFMTLRSASSYMRTHF